MIEQLPETSLHALGEALDAAPSPVAFWLRDDDATAISPQLLRLLDLADRLALPMAIAVIPARLEPEAAELLAAHPLACLMQHGYDHANHAPAGQKKRELGGKLATEEVLERLLVGAEILDRMVGDRHLPVLVPPWNRIDDDVIGKLRQAGFRGLSTFAADKRGEAAGLVHRNPQTDPIAWRTDRAFLSPPALVDAIIARIADPDTRPIGLLTHHLVMREADFETIGIVMSAIRRHEKTQWLSPTALFETES